MSSQSSQPATKADISLLKTGLAVVKTELKADVSAVKADLAAVKTDLAAVKTDLATVKADVASVKTELKAVDANLSAQIKRVAMNQANTDAKLNEIATRMSTQDDINRVLNAMDAFAKRTENHDKVIPLHGHVLTEVRVELKNHEGRIQSLESARP